MSSATQQRMKRVVIDHFDGPELLKVVEDDILSSRAGVAAEWQRIRSGSFREDDCLGEEEGAQEGAALRRLPRRLGRCVSYLLAFDREVVMQHCRRAAGRVHR